MDVISYKKAKRAEELAQQVIDGAVDTGVLQTNINEKLNALETQYAPDLDGVKSDLEEKSKQTDWFLSMSMYNVVGNGVVDDTAAFTNIETNYSGKVIDMGGKTYKVTALPINNIYVNGKFYYGGSYLDASYVRSIRANHGVIALGYSAAKNGPVFPSYSGDKYYKNVAIGGYAMQNSTGSYNNIAIGWNTLNDLSKGEYYNIGIGNEALYHTSKPEGDTDSFTATRNIGIGMNAMYFNVKGYQNIGIGRNSLQCTVNGDQNTAVGVNSMSGIAPLDLTGVIANMTKYDSNNVTAVGYNALSNNAANDNTAVGSNTAENVAKANNLTAVGRSAMNYLQKDMTTDGNVKTYWTKTGTYVWSGTTITVTITAHGLLNGYLISLGLTSGDVKSTEENHYIISNVTTDTFTITAPLTNNTSGAVKSSFYSNQTPNATVSDNNTAVGAFAMEKVTGGTNNAALGTWALRNANSSNNTMVGTLAGTNLTTGSNNTGIGYGSMRTNIDGTDTTNVTGSTAIGYNARISGSNQVQLGYTGSTTYAYGAVQDRSDIRDKADVQDTMLGLDFIEKLRPVDFKWDYREDYILVDDETGEVTYFPKDGSKKRTRYHHGVIAQEVREVINETGIDFGGFQDHSLNGGSDVLSIGYEEFIAPLIKAVQELSARVKELESKAQSDAL